jgi:CubicO group peptidase (beta-lactamase class C family)
MRRLTPLLCCISSVFIALLAAVPAVVAQPLDTDAIDELVREALKAWHVPGAAVAVVHNDRVYVKGYGTRDLAHAGRVTEDTVFALGSCSKPFTTLALALLVDDGKLQWDDPVRKHVPFFRLADPLADANVTLRDLVTHRTGLGSHDLLWYRAPWGQEEMIRKIGRVQLARSFRSGFEYQSIMFSAAGWAVGTASGGTWQEFVTRRILQPLGMASTSCTTAALGKDRANPHRRDRKGKVEVLPWYEFTEPNPAGSLNSSARDLSKFLRLQLAGGVYQGKRLVTAASLAETHTSQFALRVQGSTREMNPDTFQMSYCLGWVAQDYRGHGLLLHGGAIDGFRAQLTLVPAARLGIAVLSNLDQTLMNFALSNSLLDQRLGLPYKDWNAYYGDLTRGDEEGREAREKQRQAKRHLGTKPSRELAAYVGDYEDPAYGTAQVRLEGGRLEFRWGSFRCPLEHFHYDTFDLRHAHLIEAQAVFVLGADGEVVAVQALERKFKRKR